MSDLEARIQKGSVDPVYVLTGDEPLLGQRIVAALVAQVVVPATRAFNFDTLEAKAAGPTAILNAVRTVPMMAKRRLVIVRELEALAADGLAALIPYLEDPSPLAVVVFQTAKADGRLKFYQVAKKRGVLHELEAPRQLGPWIRAEVERRGARMTEDAIRRLGEVVGGDLGRLASAIDQLALYVGDGATIGADQVDDLVAETRERTVFELAGAVGQGQPERALAAAARLFEQRESAVGVTMMLARHMRQLALVKELTAARVSRMELPRLVNVPPFAIDGLVTQARRFTMPALLAAMRRLAKADVDLKGPVKTALGERIVMERLIGDLLALGAR